MELETARIEKLQNADQWTIWKFQVGILLKACDVFEVVSGQEAAPVEAAGVKQDDVVRKLKEWRQKDQKAQKIIATSIGQNPLLHIINCSTAHEMWDKLISVYEQRSSARKHMLAKKFYSYERNPQDDMATHIAKLETTVQQLREAGETVSEAMLITKILMTLPSDFAHFHSAWESTPSEQQTVENLIARLCAEEARLFPTHSTQARDIGDAMMAKGGEKRPKNFTAGKCFRCKKRGHWKRNCPLNNARHSVNFSKSRSKDSGDALVCEYDAFSVNGMDIVDTAVEVDDWVLDSGASHHMTFHREWFVNFNGLEDPVPVTIGDGRTIFAYGKGDIKILAFDGKNWNKKTLVDVFWVPDIKVSLFSSGSALDKNYKMTSDNTRCVISKSGHAVAVGVRRQRLYKMMFRVLSRSKKHLATVNMVKSCDSIQSWHERLGHMCVQQVRSVLKDRNVEFVDSKNFVCEACCFGKMSRVPFHESKNRAKSRAELIHADVCGPMQEPSLNGSRYFVVFKDDFSGFRKAYFMKEKSEVADMLKRFISQVRIDVAEPIKVLRSDNGREFINKDVRSLLDAEGIQHQTSVAYTPQQNGRAERDLRTIVEAARTMLHAKNLPLKLWAEAVNTAVYLLNRFGPSLVKGKSPYELWMRKKASIDDLEVFGSKVFVHVPRELRRKWDKKAQCGYFVGYPENQKGYRIWLAGTNKVEVSRDVKFNSEETTILQLDDESRELVNQPADEVVTTGSSNSSAGEVKCDAGPEETSESGSGEDEMFESISEPEQEQHEQGKQTTPIRNRLRSYKRKEQANSSWMSDVLRGYAFVTNSTEPSSYQEALRSNEAIYWKKAMDEEIESLQENSTWDLVESPEGRKIIDNKWVFKIKLSPSNKVVRYKARLVVRGFTQQRGVDYTETFSPVAKFTSIRAILAIAAAERLSLKQFDIKTAFLNGELSEDIYMCQPEGYNDGSGKVCRLKKSLYGLKQASRCWNIQFSKFLKDMNFKVSSADPCVFTLRKESCRVLMALYIDDGLIAATKEEDALQILKHLQWKFKVKTCEVGYYLGLEIQQRSDGTIHLHQAAYIDKLLSRFHMENCREVSTPAEVLGKCRSGKDFVEEIGFPYREAVGSLMYLATGTRPDISYAVGVVSRYMDNPQAMHVNAVKRIFRYLQGTRNLGICFNTNLTIYGYSDADYAGDTETRRSTSGYVFIMGNSPVSWSSRRQQCVSLSTAEAEYVAAAEAVKELVWLKVLVEDLLGSPSQPVLFLDNQSAIRLIRNPEFHRRTKHIDVRFHFIRERFERGDFDLRYITTENQIADICTKPLKRVKFQHFIKLIGLCRSDEKCYSI